MAISYDNVITLSEYVQQNLANNAEAVELFQVKQRLQIDTAFIKNKWLKIKEPSMLYILRYDLSNPLYANSLPTKEAALIVKRENHDEIIRNNDELYLNTNGRWEIIISAVDDSFSSGGDGNTNTIIDDVENITQYDSSGKVVVKFIDQNGEEHHADRNGDLYIFNTPFTGTVEYVTQ